MSLEEYMKKYLLEPWGELIMNYMMLQNKTLRSLSSPWMKQLSSQDLAQEPSRRSNAFSPQWWNPTFGLFSCPPTAKWRLLRGPIRKKLRPASTSTNWATREPTARFLWTSTRTCQFGTERLTCGGRSRQWRKSTISSRSGARYGCFAMDRVQMARGNLRC